ncbi:MAG: sle [Pseudonocardiales bacterium]|nr:sle [Pseudonocardiales bacterium]
MNRSRRAIAGLMIGAVFVLTGCSGSGSNRDSSFAGVAIDQKPAVPGLGSAATDTSASGTSASDSVERTIVRTASVTIGANEVDATADKIVALASKSGERVDGDQRSKDQDSRRAELTLRILPERLNEVVAAIDAMGREVSRSIQGEDVTATKADIDARLAALDASVTRLRTFLAQSTSVENLLALEKQLSDRQGELDAMTARQKALADEVSLATLTVTVVQTGTPAAVEKDSGPAGFGSALSDGWNGLTLAWRWVLATLGYVLPIGAVVVGVGLAAATIWRRRRGSPDPGAEHQAEPVETVSASGPSSNTP